MTEHHLVEEPGIAVGSIHGCGDGGTAELDGAEWLERAAVSANRGSGNASDD